VTTLHVADVAAAIAALDIDGVTIYDLDQMPQAVDERACPVLGPSSHEPAYLTDWTARRITTQGNYEMSYVLNYKLFQAKIGKDRGLFAQYPVMVDNAAAVLNAFLALTAVNGCKRLEITSLPQFGNIVDASGQQFHGATLSLRVTEF
jgi:hypothetical protein